VKKFLIILALLCGLGGVVFYFWYKKHKSGDNTGSDTGSDNGSGSGGSTLNSSDFPLKKGSRGEYVKRLQRYLNTRLGNQYVLTLPPLDVDGIFGDKTETMLYCFLSVREVSEALFKQKNM
jgi:hypothetical protein